MLPAAQPACLPFFSSASCSAAFLVLGRDPYRPPNMESIVLSKVDLLQTSTSDSCVLMGFCEVQVLCGCAYSKQTCNLIIKAGPDGLLGMALLLGRNIMVHMH